MEPEVSCSALDSGLQLELTSPLRANKFLENCSVRTFKSHHKRHGRKNNHHSSPRRQTQTTCLKNEKRNQKTIKNTVSPVMPSVYSIMFHAAKPSISHPCPAQGITKTHPQSQRPAGSVGQWDRTHNRRGTNVVLKESTTN